LQVTNTQKFNSHFTVNTVRLIKTYQLMLFIEYSNHGLFLQSYAEVALGVRGA